MNTIDKIRAEIKRLEEIHERNLKKPMERGRIGFAHGVVECCDRILSFIDSLPEETDNEKPNRPTNLDSLEAARDAANEVYCYTTQTMDDLVGLFLAGAQWQKEQDKPITGNSLEKEWLRYVNKAKKEYGGELPSLGEYGWLQIARHFAEWQKAQMMKEAVEGKIYGCDGLHWIETDVDENIKGKEGDKVRIIIVKEDEL